MGAILNDRMTKLKAMSLQTKTPDGLTHLEVTPAYQRRNVNLDDQHHSTDSEVSKYTLNDGEITNNSFLHGGID
jgi:cell division protein FtsZ